LQDWLAVEAELKEIRDLAQRLRFIFCNQALCAALKRLRENIIGKTDRDFYPVELAEKYIYDDRRVLARWRKLLTLR